MNSRSSVSSAPAGALKIPSRIPRPARRTKRLQSVFLGPATATAQRMDDPARHRTIINCFRALPAAHIGRQKRQKRRDPGPPRIGKPEEIIHPVTSSSEAMNHPRIKSGRRLSGPDPSANNPANRRSPLILNRIEFATKHHSSKPRQTLPAEFQPARTGASSSCPPSVFPAACACG